MKVHNYAHVTGEETEALSPWLVEVGFEPGHL